MSKRKGMLTPRQRAFVNSYYEDPQRNASRAYLKAGYTATGNAVKNNASRLLKHPDIQAEMAKRDEVIQKRHESALDELISYASQYRDKAAEAGDYRTALMANDQLAKLLGAYPSSKQQELTITLQTLLANLPEDVEPVRPL